MPLPPSKTDPLYNELFFKALRIRLVEERIIKLYPSDKIQSPVHLSIGQEAVAVGICHGMASNDLLFGTYRSHAFYLAKGGSMKQMFAELYGRRDGCGRGKAGSMHLVAPEVGFMGASAVVASTIPHAIGAALASRQLQKSQLIVTAFGDGATEEGVYHESLNFAALHRVPVIFICENNGLAVHSRQSARQSYRVMEHAAGYGLGTTTIHDGMDFVQVHRKFSRVVENLRLTGTPQFVEIFTCRYHEHVGPGTDLDCGYRGAEELNAWKRSDPLLLDAQLAAKLRPLIDDEIDEAVEFAEQSPVPDESELLADVL